MKKILSVGLAVMMLSVVANCSSSSDSTTTEETATFSPLCTPTETISSSINADKTIAADSCIGLKGIIYVTSGNTLTIGAGTKILADTSTLTALVIQNGGTITAVGTASNPIIFTSAANVGQRSPSDWGGLVIQGDANTAGPSAGTNVAATHTTEILTAGTYGGADNTDNRGTLTYVIVEFAGKEVAANAEYNGFFLAGVGSGTSISYIQSNRGSDDGIEIFGGHVNVEYGIFSNNQDDQFDVDEGWVGAASNIVTAVASDSDHAIEFDGTASGFTDNTKASNPVFTNWSILGIGSGKTKKGGIALRDQGAMQLYNSYVFNWKESDYFLASNRASEAVAAALNETIQATFFEQITNSSGTALTPDTMGCADDKPTDCSSATAIGTLFPDGFTNNNVGNAATIPSTSQITAQSSWTSASQMVPTATITTTFANPPAAGSGKDYAAPTYAGAFAANTNWATWAQFNSN